MARANTNADGGQKKRKKKGWKQNPNSRKGRLGGIQPRKGKK